MNEVPRVCAPWIAQGVNQDIHEQGKSETVQSIDDNCEKFDRRTENLFRYLQASIPCH